MPKGSIFGSKIWRARKCISCVALHFYYLYLKALVQFWSSVRQDIGSIQCRKKVLSPFLFFPLGSCWINSLFLLVFASAWLWVQNYLFCFFAYVTCIKLQGITFIKVIKRQLRAQNHLTANVSENHLLSTNQFSAKKERNSMFTRNTSFMAWYHFENIPK